METTENDVVKIETMIGTSIENVWKAWTDPVLISKWFGSDPNGKVLHAKLDVQPGGVFEITFKDSDQTEHTCSGVYAEVEELVKLSFTWNWKSEPGFESFVTLVFTSQGEQTSMQFQHALAGNASKHNYLVGWTTTFQKLEYLLTK